MGKRVNTMFEKLVINFFFNFSQFEEYSIFNHNYTIKRLLRALYNSNV